MLEGKAQFWPDSPVSHTQVLLCPPPPETVPPDP